MVLRIEDLSPALKHINYLSGKAILRRAKTEFEELDLQLFDLNSGFIDPTKTTKEKMTLQRKVRKTNQEFKSCHKKLQYLEEAVRSIEAEGNMGF